MKKLLLTGFAFLAIGAQAQSWTMQNSKFPQGGTYPVAFSAVDANTVWAMGADGTGSGANLQSFTRTSDGGANWTGGQIDLGNATLLISDISAVSATTAWVMATTSTGGAGGGVWKTTNGGSSWAKQVVPGFNKATAFPNVVHFFDENVGFLMGDPDNTKRYELYNTVDGGATWTRNPVGNSPSVTDEYGYTHLKVAVGDVVWFGTDLGRVMKSNDRGVNWTIASTPIIDFGGTTTAGANGTFTLKDGNTGWVMDQDGLIYKTTDAALNWDAVTLESGSVYTSALVYVPGTANTLISGGQNAMGDRGSSISTDGGLNWTNITPVAGDPNGIPTLVAVNPSAVYGGGFSDPNNAALGGMNKLSPLNMATANSVLAKNAVSIYPNPTKGNLKVASRSAIKSILVVDMNGRVMKSFDNISQIDLSNLSKGVYMLNITMADGQSTSTKVIKE